jgi:hypothetical protein
MTYVYRLQVQSLMSKAMMWAGDYDTRREAQDAFARQYGGEGRRFTITRVRLA